MTEESIDISVDGRSITESVNKAGSNTQLPSNLANASVFDRVAFVIDRIRPAVQNDGGDIELVEVSAQGVVTIRMHGACVGCPSSNMTLRIGIEKNLKDHIPEVQSVRAIES